jgi:hypothetical protein
MRPEAACQFNQTLRVPVVRPPAAFVRQIHRPAGQRFRSVQHSHWLFSFRYNTCTSHSRSQKLWTRSAPNFESLNISTAAVGANDRSWQFALERNIQCLWSLGSYFKELADWRNPSSSAFFSFFLSFTYWPPLAENPSN